MRAFVLVFLVVVGHYEELKYRSRRDGETEAVNKNDKKTEEDF